MRILLEMSLSASLLILIVTGIRSLGFHRLPKLTFVVLWGVALGRLFIPFSIVSPFRSGSGANSWNQVWPQNSIPALLSLVAPGPASQAARLTQAAAPVSPFPFLQSTWLISLIWIAGVLACGLFFLLPHWRAVQEYRTALPLDNPFITHWTHKNKLLRRVQVRQLDRIGAPFTYGILHPVILLPKGVERIEREQLENVLVHELTHVRRFDALWKGLLAAGLCLHWFNPLVWLMYVLANRDLEFACDEEVMRRLDPVRRSAYAVTLISMEERRSMKTLLVNHFSKNAIKERIDSIMKPNKTTLMGIIIALLLVVIIMLVFALTGPLRIVRAMPGGGSAISAAPVMLDQNTPAGVSTGTNNGLIAQPVMSNPLSATDLSTLLAGATDAVNASDLISSTSPRAWCQSAYKHDHHNPLHAGHRSGYLGVSQCDRL